MSDRPDMPTDGTPWPADTDPPPMGGLEQLPFEIRDRARPLIGARVEWHYVGPEFERPPKEEPPSPWMSPGVVVEGPLIFADGEGVYLAHIVVLQDDGLVRLWRITEPGMGSLDPYAVKVTS